MPQGFPGSIRRPRRRWRRPAICCGSSRPSIPQPASLRMEECWRSSEPTRGCTARWCKATGNTARPCLACDLAAVARASATSCAPAPMRAMRICACGWLSCGATCANCSRASPSTTAPKLRLFAVQRIGSATLSAAAPTRRIPTCGPASCWRGPTRIGSAGRAATVAGTCWRTAAARAAAEPQALAKAEFIVAAELDGSEREARIFLAAPVRLADLEEHFSAHILDQAEILWRTERRALRSGRGASAVSARCCWNPSRSAIPIPRPYRMPR